MAADLDEEARALVLRYDDAGMDAALLRYDGDTIAVICGDTKTAIALMQRALEELTVPTGKTKH